MRALLLCAALAGCISPAGRTTTLAMAATGALITDWVQTRGIVDKCQERNPVIGPCGESFAPDVYFPVVIIGVLALAAAAGPWGDAVLAGVVGIEGATVWSNAVTP